MILLGLLESLLQEGMPINPLQHMPPTHLPLLLILS